MKKEDIYPCTIVDDRYNGSYSGGKWTAWMLDPENVPSAISEDDITCDDFWLEEAKFYIIGKGNSPMEAYKELYKKLNQK